LYGAPPPPQILKQLLSSPDLKQLPTPGLEGRKGHFFQCCLNKYGIQKKDSVILFTAVSLFTRILSITLVQNTFSV
jgi:hypothetical protein